MIPPSLSGSTIQVASGRKTSSAFLHDDQNVLPVGRTRLALSSVITSGLGVTLIVGNISSVGVITGETCVDVDSG